MLWVNGQEEDDKYFEVVHWKNITGYLPPERWRIEIE